LEKEPASEEDKDRGSQYRNFVRYRDLVLGLALRDVKMRYQLSVLGLYWAILNPLLMALIWAFVFSKIFRATGMEGVPYVVFLFGGLTFWNLFANSLITATNSLTGNASLLSKLYFPRVILPTASVLARLVDFGFSLIVLVIFMEAYHVRPSLYIEWIPLLLIIQLFFTLGMAYLVASLNVLYRDVSQMVGVILLLWMYLSPIFYTIDQIPAGIKRYFLFNAVGELVNMQSTLVLGGSMFSFHTLGVVTLISVGVFVLGLVVFHRLEPLFAEVM
jgi:ABC-2 type transport system permease protein